MMEPFDQVLTYRGYTISYDPTPIPARNMDWHFQHEQFDGAEDAGDPRNGHASSPQECMEEIDFIEDDGR